MFIPVSCSGILFRNCQSDRFLGTGMYAGQAGLTISRHINCLSGRHPDRTRRTDLPADPAAGTKICNLQKMLPCILRHLTHPVQELPVGGTVLFRYL